LPSVLLLLPGFAWAISPPVSVRTRLLVMLVLALGAVATAVATAQKGGSHKAAKTRPAKAMPGPPLVRHQDTPTTPRQLGNVPAINGARRLAGILWCVDFRVADYGGAKDAGAMRLLGGG